MRRPWLFALLMPTMLTMLGGAPAAALDRAAWDAILRQHVDEQGRVAYRALAARSLPALDAYLSGVAAADLTALPRKEALAFYLNAYNALVFKGILEGGNGEGLLARRRFFRVKEYRVAGATINLEDLENEVIRARFADARVHFALVCAAVSCPRLSREAYTAANLDELLDRQGRAFLADSVRNPLGPGPSAVRVSSIFKWFRADFERDAGSLAAFLSRYAPAGAPACLADGDCAFRFEGYDWTVNAQPGERID